MNKFLLLCFKFGKWFVSFVLVILIILGVYFVINAIQNDAKVNTYKMVYQWSEDGLSNITQQNQISSNRNENISKKNSYNEEIIKAFADKNKPTDKFVNIVSNYIINNVEERDINDFISNFPTYYEAVKQSLFEIIKQDNRYRNINIEQIYKDERADFDNEILKRYASRYEANVKLRAAQKAEALTARNTSLMALLIVLSMFIVTLIVPVLIKIEENTRKN